MSPGRPRRSSSRGRRSPLRRRSPRRSRSRSRNRRSPPRYSDRRSRSPRRRSRSRSRNRPSPRRSLPGRRISPRRSPRRSPPPKSLGKRVFTPPRRDGPEKGRGSSPPRKDTRVSKAKAETARKVPSMPSENQVLVTSIGKSVPALKKSSDRKISPRKISPPRRRSFSPRRPSCSPGRRRSKSPPRRRSRSPRRRSGSPHRRRSRSSRSPPLVKGKSDHRDDVPLKPEHRQPKHIVEEEEKLLYGDVDERGVGHGHSSGQQDRDDRQMSDRWPDRDNRIGGEWVKPKKDTDERQIITHFIPEDEYELPNNPGYFLPRTHQSMSLHERYSDPREKPFIFSENISIGIERNIRGNSPVRRKPYQPGDVLIPRREDEGKVPLHKREEFEKQGFVERRVIKVLRSEQEDKADALLRYEAEFQRQSDLPDRGQGGVPWQNSRRSRSRDRGLDRSYTRRSPDRSRGRSRDRDDRYRDRKERSLSRDQRVVLNRSSLRGTDARVTLVGGARGDDVRIVSERDRYERGDLRRTIGNRSPEGSSSRHVRGPKDLRFNLMRRTKPNFDARMKIGKPRDGRDEHPSKRDILPDFSKRPDKFKDESWLNDPSSIPKGGAYYEHDNRESDRLFRGFRGRGRGPPRGGFRGRGFFRGRLGFVGRRGDKKEGRWEHDKFQDLEDDKDKEPSSTTK